MKRTQDILGLPIISISDGIEVGKVKSIIINADKGAIDYIVVDSGIQIMGARVVSTSDVLGIGEYALTIESESVINDIGKNQSALDLLQKNIQVKSTKVLTKKGRLIGEIGDIYVDEDNACVITGVEFISDDSQKKITIIPRERIITFGKNLAIVTDDVESSLVDQPSHLTSVDNFFEKKNEFLSTDFSTKSDIIEKKDEEVEPTNFDFFKATEINSEVASENIESVVATETFTVENSQPEGQEVLDFRGSFREDESVGIDNENNTSNNSEGDSANLFEQRQKQYLIGRKATKTITDDFGNVLIENGEIITEEAFEKVKNAQKMVEIVMNNKV